MAVLRNRLTLAVAEVGDELAKKLVESGEWDPRDDSVAPTPRKRTTPRRPEDSGE